MPGQKSLQSSESTRTTSFRDRTPSVSDFPCIFPAFQGTSTLRLDSSRLPPPPLHLQDNLFSETLRRKARGSGGFRHPFRTGEAGFRGLCAPYSPLFSVSQWGGSVWFSRLRKRRRPGRGAQAAGWVGRGGVRRRSAAPAGHSSRRAGRCAGYVGSASGTDNLLGRWQNYAATGHGGNVGLRRREPVNFRFSILERLSPDMQTDEICVLENLWKVRLSALIPNRRDRISGPYAPLFSPSAGAHQGGRTRSMHNRCRIDTHVLAR